MITIKWQRRFLIAILGIATIAIVLSSVFNRDEMGGVRLPHPPHITDPNIVYLNEKQGWPSGWEEGQSDWFHHTSQGTRILPYSWFKHLEQPVLTWSVGKFSDPAYLERFGFQRSKENSKLNPENLLPIGFAIDSDFDAPYAKPPSRGKEKVVGLTCAACHTGRISWVEEGGSFKAAVIEGGSAMINLAAFQEAIGQAIALTLNLDGRFDRFARAVIAEEKSSESKAEEKSSSESKDELRERLEQYFAVGLANREELRVRKLSGTEAGFGRTDALGLIGNRVFGVSEPANLTVADAPVNIPPLWTTPWFDWVQYNSSIRMPMVRNIGEALGVGAPVNLAAGEKAYASTVKVLNLDRMEHQLAGNTELGGLQSPKWSDTGLQPPDPNQVKQGKKVYQEYCMKCHLRPIDELKSDYQDGDWDHDSEMRSRFLKLVKCDLHEIGTDPNQAMNLYRRVAVLNGKTISATHGLFAITELVRRRKIQELNAVEGNDYGCSSFSRDRYSTAHSAPENEILNGEHMKDVLRANLSYKARPLNGIWATPPYLHNGSVPNLYQLLLPADRRDDVFFLGTTLFDTKHVGYKTEEFSGAFRFDTSLPGNSNEGHEFRNLTLEELELAQGHNDSAKNPKRHERLAHALEVPVDELKTYSEEKIREKTREATKKALDREQVQRERPFKGILGPELKEQERWDLIEYLKTL